MTIVVFTDAVGVPWKVWLASSRLVFHAKTGARRVLRLDETEIPDLHELSDEPQELEKLCEKAREENAA